MNLIPHTLSLIVTHKCTAACDHCCFSCHPGVSDHVPVPNLHKYIDQAVEVTSLAVVVFTGGECFLLGSDLDDLVGHAADNGFITRFVSNGYWATTLNIAAKRLSKLIDKGLAEANFSTGDMHQKYVKPEYVRNGAIAAADAGLNVNIMVENFQNSKFDFESFIGDSTFSKYLEEERISIRTSPWMGFSGKTEIKQSTQYSKFVREHTSGIGCSTVLRVIAITPKEQLMACCGLTMEDIEEVQLGDLRQFSIREIIDSQPDDFLKIWIHMEGPEAVVNFARRFDASIELPESCVHVCDTCRFMYHDDKIKDVLRKNPHPRKKQLLDAYYRSLYVTKASPKDLVKNYNQKLTSGGIVTAKRALALQRTAS